MTTQERIDAINTLTTLYASVRLSSDEKKKVKEKVMKLMEGL